MHIWVTADQKVAYVAPNQKWVTDKKLWGWLFSSLWYFYMAVAQFVMKQFK